jgi:hypothetical protein
MSDEMATPAINRLRMVWFPFFAGEKSGGCCDDVGHHLY